MSVLFIACAIACAISGFVGVANYRGIAYKKCWTIESPFLVGDGATNALTWSLPYIYYSADGSFDCFLTDATLSFLDRLGY